MALANVGTLLALWGRKVLLVDWDLEAPGLEKFFSAWLRGEEIRRREGVLDLLTHCFDSPETGNPVASWLEAPLAIHLPKAYGQLHLLSAGKRDDSYFKRLQQLDLRLLYSENSGGRVLEDIRNAWKDVYDFVLVDSRTGITDIAGICTVQLPDSLVLLLTATEQSVEGILNVFEKTNEARQRLPFDRPMIPAIPVPGRFDTTTEFQLYKEWIDRFAVDFAEIFAYWMPQDLDVRNFLENIKLPYIPYFSFGEKLPVIEQGTSDPAGLGYALENLASFLSLDFENVSEFLNDRAEYVREAKSAFVDAKVDISRLAQYAPRTLFGRDAELDQMETALTDPDIGVFCLIAFGGVGKTALVAHWLADLAKQGWPGLERIFGWSFYSQGVRDDGAASADAFFTAAFTFFGSDDPGLARLSAWDKGVRLGRLVAKRRSLLVLDGLEPLQYPPGPMDGRLKEQGIEALLLTLAQSARNGARGGLCLVTSREKVVELEALATAAELRLEFLSDSAGAALLHSLGVKRAGSAWIAADDAELREASREVQGHALTLTILGRYLREAHRGDLRKRDAVDLVGADDTGSGQGHAFRAMAAYEKWLAEGGADGARRLAVLRLLGLFDRPADPGCLAALRREPAIAGLTEPLCGLGEEEWNLAVADLQAAGLVQTAPYAPRPVLGYGEEIARKAMEARERRKRFDLGEPTAFPSDHRLPTTGHCLDAHPLLRDYFARRLRDAQPDAWREGHRRLFEHLSESVPYWPEGEAGLQPLYQAVAHGCRAGLYEEARAEVYRDRILRRGEFYSAHKLGLFGADLGAMAGCFESGWSRPVSALSEAARAWLLNEAATRLRALGRLREALEPMRVSGEMSVERKEWESAAASYGNLSELEGTLGRVEAAVDDAGRAVDYADRSGDAFQRMSMRTSLADALHQAGRRDEALERFREAEALQAERQPGYPLLYSLQGFRYCDALLAEAERAAWRIFQGSTGVSPVEGRGRDARAPVAERAARTLPIAERNNWLLDVALDHLTLARAALYTALPNGEAAERTTARTHATAAVDGLRAAGTQNHLPRALLTRAWLQAVEGNPEAARADLDDAERIASRGEMRLHLADVHLHRARLFRDRDALARASQLIEECGYGRRRGELEDAERAAAGW